MVTRALRPVQTTRHQEKREVLLDAAAGLFNERGVKGANLADIAAAVGLVTTSVTYYFRRKEDLAAACLLRSIEAIGALADEAADEPQLPARIHRFAARFAALLADIETVRHPRLILFNDVRALSDAQADAVFAAYTSLFRRVRALLKAPQTAHLTPDEMNARAHLLLSVINGFRAWASRYEPDEYPVRMRRVADLLLHGLAAAGVRWSARDSTRVCLPLEPPVGTAEAFLRAASQLINDQGFRGASVERIAASVNLTKGSFYHHNDTKQDLITACFERSFAAVRDALRQAELGPGSGWQRACAVTQALVRHQMSEAGPLLRWSATSALPDQGHRDDVARTIRRLQERTASLLAEGMQEGSIRTLDQSIAAQYLLSSINAAAELRRWVRRIDMGSAGELYARPVMLGIACA